ncbi:MAG: DUF362 domain-containing protein [bacterium]
MSATVAIQRCENYELDIMLPAMRGVMDHLGGLASFVLPGNRVLLKPNMLSGDRPERAVTTHPAVVEAMILLCQEAGATPIVGDSAALGSAKRTSKGCGVAEVCQRHGVPVIDLGTSLPGKANPILGVARPQITDKLSQFDAIVNLPKVKVHQQIYLTLAVKNMYGCVPGRRKALWHFLLRHSVDQFARMVVATLMATQPTISVADAVIAMERSGPRDGDPRQVGLLVAGTDCVAVDRVLVEILGARMEDYPVLFEARKMKIGETDLSAIDIRGLSISDSRAHGFRLLEEITPIGFSFPHIIRGIWHQLRRRTLPLQGKQRL